MRRFMLAAAALAALSGCFTVSQTDYPQTETSPAAEGAPTLALSGFEATVTRYVPIYGYTTVWNPGPGYYHHGRYYRESFPERVSTTTYLPQTEITTAYVEKAQSILEQAGYLVSPTNATHVIDVTFSGPRVTDNDRTCEFLSVLLTVTLADRTSAVWSARLRVSDAVTGKVLMSQEYVQPYVAWVVSPIPLFGPLSGEAIQSDYIQNWCLSALTDRAVADATAFLAAEKAAK